MMLERLGRSPWNCVMNAAILECLAAIEKPAAGRKKVTPVRCAWDNLRSKQSAEGHGLGVNPKRNVDGGPGFPLICFIPVLLNIPRGDMARARGLPCQET